MDPMTMSLLLSFAPSLLSGLFGDPQKKYLRKARQLMSPQNLANLTNQFYQQQIGSPAFAQGQGAIAAGANQASNQVASSLAQRGIGTTGTAAVLSGLTPSLVGSQQAGLRTAAHQSAQSQAQQNIERQLALLAGTSGPSQTQNMFAGGLEAFIPYLMAMMGGNKGAGGSPYGSRGGDYSETLMQVPFR